MDLFARGVRDAGDLVKERLVLEAAKTTDVGRYLVLAARLMANREVVLGGRVPYCFWFPDTEIKEGDLVILYSKAGKIRSKDNAGGSVSHFFYWGNDESIWSDQTLLPVVVRSSQWKALRQAMLETEDET